MASVLVLGETADGGLTALSAELIGAASRISGDLDGGVSCALIGRGTADAAPAAVAAGADTVYVVDDLRQGSQDAIESGAGFYQAQYGDLDVWW